jgi:hypothetical protein
MLERPFQSELGMLLQAANGVVRLERGSSA